MKESPELDSEQTEFLQQLDQKIENAKVLLEQFTAKVEARRQALLKTPPPGLFPYQVEIMAKRMRAQCEREWANHFRQDSYRTRILPLRKAQGLATIMAHGTTSESLFGASSRKPGVGRKGILFDGLQSGDFGGFERTEAGGQGGWWASLGTAGSSFNSTIWILQGEETQRSLVVVPSPKTYVAVLEKLKDRIENGDTLSPAISEIVHIGELAQMLQTSRGRLP